MDLFAVVAGDTRPVQCVTVWDSRDRAQALADYLNSAVRDVVTVWPVDSFFPAGMRDAESIWHAAASKFIQEEDS